MLFRSEAKSLGLGASFGGDAGDSLFGTSTASVLKKFTAWIGGIFIICCVLLSFWTISIGHKIESTEPTRVEEMDE